MKGLISGVDLNQEILNHLYKIYVEVVGPCSFGAPRLEDMARIGEYRAGSRWSNNSKFEIACGGVHFYPNFDASPSEKREVNRAVKEFDKRVEDYLTRLNQKKN